MNMRDRRAGTAARWLLTAGMALVGAVAAAEKDPVQAALEQGHDVAVLAGGCFWCVESDFDHVDGVLDTISGYTGGSLENPGYRDVTAGGTGHREAVAIVYDPRRVSYERLLHVFWRSVDPTDGGGQFCDRGESYTTAIFPRNDAQRAIAEASKEALANAGTLPEPVATTIEPLGPFYRAEGYHQDYYRKNPVRYNFYRFSCGRDGRLEDLWGDEALEGIKAH